MADQFEFEGEVEMLEQEGGYAYSAIRIGNLILEREVLDFFKPGVRYRITIEEVTSR